MLKIDIDKVHRYADIEEREIIREAQYLGALYASKQAELEEVEEANLISQSAELFVDGSELSPMEIDEVHASAEQVQEDMIAEQYCIQQEEYEEEQYLTSAAGQQSFPFSPQIDVEAGELHAQAIADEEYNQRLIWKRSQSLSTALMVAKCQKEKLDQNRKPGIEHATPGGKTAPKDPP